MSYPQKASYPYVPSPNPSSFIFSSHLQNPKPKSFVHPHIFKPSLILPSPPFSADRAIPRAPGGSAPPPGVEEPPLGKDSEPPTSPRSKRRIFSESFWRSASWDSCRSWTCSVHQQGEVTRTYFNAVSGRNGSELKNGSSQLLRTQSPQVIDVRPCNLPAAVSTLYMNIYTYIYIYCNYLYVYIYIYVCVNHMNH